MHTFAAKNMLIMRGDFVHTGGPGYTPRAHLEFFPRESVGWSRKRSFWNFKSNNNRHPTFLWQHPTFPFAYPIASDPNEDGDIILTYPPSTTSILTLPLSRKQCKKDGLDYAPESRQMKSGRRVTCARMQIQSW
jgi:hypothetical protein